jgi:hypothetical protein
MSPILLGLAVMCWEGAPAAGEQREPAFAEAAQGPQGALSGLSGSCFRHRTVLAWK